MGSEFWWFYDVIVIAVILVSVFISGKKGFIKGAFTSVGCAIAVLLAFAVSGGAAESLYKSTLRTSCINTLEKNMKSAGFTQKYAVYLEEMGYFISVNTEKLESAFASDKELDKALCDYVNNINSRKAEENEDVLISKIREGYAEVMSDIITQSLNKFAAETAASEIRADSSGMKELIIMMNDSKRHHEAAVYIADNYTSKAYITVFRAALFTALYIITALVIIAFTNAFSSKDSGTYRSIGSHISGGFMGLITGIIMTFAVSVIVRLWAILGSNEMLFFNSAVIDKTIIFKYFYDLTLKM